MSSYRDGAAEFSPTRSPEDASDATSGWDMGSDAFECCFEEPVGEAMHRGMRAPQPGLDRHLPLLHDRHGAEQDGMVLGLVGEDYPGCHAHHGPDSACLERAGDRDYSESDGNVAPRKRNRSTSCRHRYEVVSELGAEEVRWFYKEDRRTWKPFVGYDSLKIELMYRKFCELNPGRSSKGPCPADAEDEENPRKEAAAAPSEGVNDVATRPAESGIIRGLDGRRAVERCDSADGAAGIDVDPVCVRGGLYEVDVKDRECYPVYWNQQDRIPVMRGQWFTDGTWLPLEEEESDLIELEHLARFRGQQMQDAFDTDTVSTTVDSKDAIHSLKLSRSHVDWHSVDEVYLYSDATTSKIARTVTQKLGFSKVSSSGTRLHRGYVEESSLEDRPPQTTHLVFVVHGIGQKMDQLRIIKNTGMMRDAARKMEEKHFSERAPEHVEFLPVEWRSKLSLDGDTVDSITPDKVRGLRDMLNSSAMDIMYYTSPLYRDEITKGLTQELNRLYTLFCSRNPEFEEKGKVSIVSHSLGCVITFDIMTGWDPMRFYLQEALEAVETDASKAGFKERDLLEQLYLTRLRLRELEDQLDSLHPSTTLASPALKFKVENFFCMGSPLAVFLALRGIRPGNSGTQDHILPKSICQRLFNIFHPTDPVAYRLEPLILKHYSNIAPVQIHWYNTTSPTPYDQIRPTLINPAKEATSDTESNPSPSTSPVMTRRHYGESITNLGKASILGAASIGKGIGGILFSRFSRSSSQASGAEGMAAEGEGQCAEGSGSMSPSTSTSTVMDTSLELERRIDFELREGLVESRYWSAVTSHTGYWCSHDVALFLLTFMYQQEDLAEISAQSPVSV
ncbi:phospholipase DDHD1b [Paramormyrops kingsleyae]|uniref:phospholipase DDHD1b n=1 Tax=Paramormyrops kingsleyae TaxID=1676925 RepID=UPI003B979724